MFGTVCYTSYLGLTSSRELDKDTLLDNFRIGMGAGVMERSGTIIYCTRGR